MIKAAVVVRDQDDPTAGFSLDDEDEVVAGQAADFVDWENPPTISDLKQNIDDAELDQEGHRLDVEKWLENRAVERTAIPGRSNVAPKVIRKQNEWRYSSLADPFLSTPDLFNVKPVTAGDRNRALQNQQVLNYQFNNKLKKVKFIDDFVHEAVDVGTVIVKTGWITHSEKITTSVPEYQYLLSDSPELAQKYMQLLQMRQQSADQYGDISTPGLDHALDMFRQTGEAFFVKPTGNMVEATKIVETKNHPILEVPHNENIIIDPSCNGDISIASFVGEKFKASKGSLKLDGKYKNIEKIQIKAVINPADDPDYTEEGDVETFTFKDDVRKQFVVFTYWGDWDIHGDGLPQQIVCSWVGNTMIRLEENPFPDRRPPFSKAVYMPVRDSLFGEPDAALLEDNQAIIGAVTRGIIDLFAKSANSQTGTKKGFLDVTNKRRFKNGQDYEYNANSDPRQAIFQHTFPEVPQSAYNLINLQNMEAESLTGVKAFASGISGKGLGDTAASVRGALDAASKRELGILRRLADCIIDVGRKIVSMNSEFLSEEEVIRITDGEFVEIRRDDLAGEFDIALSISTAEEDAKKAQELAFMYQTGGPNMDPELGKMILADIARLRKMPDFAKRIEDYQPQPSPLEQAKAQKEMELLDAQIQKELALANKHNADAAAAGGRSMRDQTQGQLNQAKVAEVTGNAKKSNSEADIKDLEYLDKESGKDHLRAVDKDKQRISAESQARIQEKAVDSLINSGGETEGKSK